MASDCDQSLTTASQIRADFGAQPEGIACQSEEALVRPETEAAAHSVANQEPEMTAGVQLGFLFLGSRSGWVFPCK